MERQIMPEKLVSWVDIARGVGEVALQTVRRMLERHHETPQHRPEHYRLVLDQPKPNVFVYSCDGGDYPRQDQLQLDFETQTLGDVPVLPRLQPPENRWDDMGTYL